MDLNKDGDNEDDNNEGNDEELGNSSKNKHDIDLNSINFKNKHDLNNKNEM